MRGQFVREHGDEVLALLGGCGPPPTAESSGPGGAARDPGRRRREEGLKAFRSARAAERGVTPSVVLPNPLVEQLAAAPPPDLDALSRVQYLGEKRVRLYGAELLQLLADA